MSRNKQMVLNFSIEGGVVVFDVENGDGTSCEALAAVFTEGGDVADLKKKTEYNQAESGHRVGRTA